MKKILAVILFFIGIALPFPCGNGKAGEKAVFEGDDLVVYQYQEAEAYRNVNAPKGLDALTAYGLIKKKLDRAMIRGEEKFGGYVFSFLSPVRIITVASQRSVRWDEGGRWVVEEAPPLVRETEAWPETVIYAVILAVVIFLVSVANQVRAEHNGDDRKFWLFFAAVIATAVIGAFACRLFGRATGPFFGLVGVIFLSLTATIHPLILAGGIVAGILAGTFAGNVVGGGGEYCLFLLAVCLVSCPLAKTIGIFVCAQRQVCAMAEKIIAYCHRY